MHKRTKIFMLFLASLGFLVYGKVMAQSVTNHQITLKAHNVGQGSKNRNYPEFTNPANYVLTVKPNDTMTFHFPGKPSSTTITIRSQVKIDQNSSGSPPYEYDGAAGFTVNPEKSTNQIKYDVIVESADDDFETLDPVIIVDNLDGGN